MSNEILNEVAEQYGMTPERLAKVVAELWQTLEMYEQHEVMATFKLLKHGVSSQDLLSSISGSGR